MHSRHSQSLRPFVPAVVSASARRVIGGAISISTGLRRSSMPRIGGIDVEHGHAAARSGHKAERVGASELALGGEFAAGAQPDLAVAANAGLLHFGSDVDRERRNLLRGPRRLRARE